MEGAETSIRTRLESRGDAYAGSFDSRKGHPRRRISLKAFGFIAACGLFTLACGSPREYPASPAVNMYYRGEVQKAFTVQEARLKGLPRKKDGKRNIDWVLEALRLVSCAQAAGKFKIAEDTATTCVRIIDDFKLDMRAEKAAGLFGEEATAPFKGYPYERSMTSMYHGLLRYRRHDYNNAQASFMKALSEDWVGADDKFISDWVLAHVMRARCLYKMDEAGEAGNALKFAAKFAARQGYKKQHPYIQPKPAREDNLVFVVELGGSPEKKRTGKHDEAIKILPRPGNIKRVTYQADNGPEVEIPEIDSVYYQATTRGERKFEQVLKGQVEFKEVTGAVAETAAWVATLSDDRNTQLVAAAVWLGAAIASASTRTEADNRYWETLPDRLLYASTYIKPGVSVLTVRFYSDANAELPNQRRTMIVTVPAPPDLDRLVWIRELPGTGGVSLPDDPLSAVLYGISVGEKVYGER